MKKINLILTLTALSSVLFSFTYLSNVTTFKADPKKSTIAWTGKKVTGEHKGNISVSNGTLTTDGKSLTGGNFEIDMNSITCTDLTDPGYNKKLVDHLKNEDFFAVEKFPKAKFVISKATAKGGNNYDVAGKLTIKNITQEITFPAVVTIGGKEVSAEGQISVDRTKYDIKYGSDSFFDNLGDKAISNEFLLDFKIVASK